MGARKKGESRLTKGAGQGIWQKVPAQRKTEASRKKKPNTEKTNQALRQNIKERVAEADKHVP